MNALKLSYTTSLITAAACLASHPVAQAQSVGNPKHQEIQVAVVVPDGQAHAGEIVQEKVAEALADAGSDNTVGVRVGSNGEVTTKTAVQTRGGGVGGGGSFGVGEAPAFQDRLQTIIRHASGQNSVKSLVIRSSNPDTKEDTNLEEDLAVMSHILDKTIEDLSEGRGHGHSAMGINVFFNPAGNSMRNFYLEDYGAVFMLNVGFPLLAPSAKAEEQKESSSTGSAWAEAKAEVFGDHTPGHSSAASEPYDAEKVERLKTSILEALKNATNIRGVKSDESVTVCVFGTGGPGKAKAAPHRSHNGDSDVMVWFDSDNSDSQRGTVLTIRVKKSDLDAFAKGSLKLEDLRHKAKVTTYAGAASHAAGGPVMSWSGSAGNGFTFSR